MGNMLQSDRVAHDSTSMALAEAAAVVVAAMVGVPRIVVVG